MKIVAISDTHGHLPKPDTLKGDVLLIAGDIAPAYDHSVGFQEQWFKTTFIDWCKKIIDRGLTICWTGGNHDWYLEELYKNGYNKEFKDCLPENCHYLLDEMVIINDVKIFASPWQPIFYDWAFNLTEEQLEKKFALMPACKDRSIIDHSDNIDILLSHGPAMGYSDLVLQHKRTDHLGSKALLNRVKEVLPRYVITGHIHSADHNWQSMTAFNQEIKFACVSLLDEQYKVAYKPLEFKI